MNYKVLYRKYRPNDFDNIVGQEYIIKTLKNSVSSGNISHAYIFSGPRGTGKTSTAKVFAKAINCLSSKDGSPCGKCEFCLNYNDNPDIIEIDAASHNGVDQIRELIDNVKLIPSNGKYKVYIIDEVHMLTTSAFNALLLTLEEPPSHVVFIFATTNVENVPITILSRCQRFDFRKITVEDIVTQLNKVCKAEKISIQTDAIREIALLSEGGLRDALSILDQLSKNDEKITMQIVEQQMKTISNNSINEMLDNLEMNNPTKILDFLELLKEKAIDYKVFTKKMVNICSQRAKNIKLGTPVKRLGYNDYTNLVLSLIDLTNKTNIHVDSYMLLELELLKYIDKDLPEIPREETEEKVEEKKTQVSKKTQIKNFDKLIEVRVNNTFVNAKKEHLNQMISYFDTFKNYNGNKKKYKQVLMDVVPVVASDTHVIFQAENKHHAYNLNEILKELQESFNKINKTNYKMIFISKERWEAEKKQYIENLKNKYTYEMREEDIEDDTKEIVTIVDGLFDKEKIEIV